jgi:REP element-mobilizing transposase RayT
MAPISCTLSRASVIDECPLLRSAQSHDRILSVLEQARKRYRFVVVGYVMTPEHIHLLLSEPEVGTPSTVMQVLKQRSARALLPKVRTPGLDRGTLWVSNDCDMLGDPANFQRPLRISMGL